MNSGFYRRNKNSGFSLIEIIVSFSIFSLFANIIFNLTSNSTRQYNHAENINQAALLADQTLEAVRNIRDENFDNLAVGIFDISSTTGEWAFTESFSPIGTFNRQIEILDIEENQKQVDVLITWADSSSPGNQFEISSIFTNWRKDKIKKQKEK
ncbi:MAG TPA: type II secretion system protein [Candidatus Paceibacterota bacterium]|nr:type II secretion system protein [Candidatus Paceibacterota bacterium]HRZ34676.1 type II secretion system protein [Candidatus Paceibacterota bacterium]